MNRPANDRDRERFHHEWAAFERGEEAQSAWARRSRNGRGSRASRRWSPCSESQAIFTVEDVAGLPDGRVGALGMGGYKLRDEAKGFIVGAADNARADEAEAIRAENADLKARLAALEAKMAEEPARRKPGPKPKKAPA